MYCSQGEDKEDLFQDILLQLWRAYPTFNNGAKVTTWMYRVALNTAISRLRKNKGGKPVEALSDEAFKIEAVNDEESVARSRLMYAAIERLTDIERAITMLYMVITATAKLLRLWLFRHVIHYLVPMRYYPTQALSNGAT